MLEKLFVILSILSLTLLSCSKNEIVENESVGFPVLSYNSEISETLTLNPENIQIDDPKEYFFWSQHFLNPTNDINNIYTNATFENKIKIISGKKGPVNIIQPVFFNSTLCSLINDGFINCTDTISEDILFKIDIKPEGIKKYEVIRGGLAYFDGKLIFG